jgi:putative hydrolase of HD superfamily
VTEADGVRLLPQDAAGVARFLHRSGALKATPRTGWLDRGIGAEEAESVADHTFRTALLAWLAAAFDSGLDAGHVLQLALLHDLAEAVTGDDPPYDPADLPEEDDPEALRSFLDRRHVRSDERREAKRRAEAAAMADLLSGLPALLAEPLAVLWAELEAATTPESRFVKQADKLETYLQSREYQKADPERPVASFAAEVATAISSPSLISLRDAIAALNIESES